MSTSASRARHRSAVRPITPLTDLAKSLSEMDATRGIAVAAGAGVALSIGAAGMAIADPGDSDQATPQEQSATVKVEAAAKAADPVAQAQVAVAANPEITTPDASWNEGAANVPTAEAPAPAPAPAPVRQQTARVRNVQTAGTVRAPQRTANRAAAPQRAVRAATRAAAPAPAPAAAPAPAPAAAPAPASAVGGSVVDIAMRYQGVPYVYGGSSPKGFDCSGFVQYAYRQVGKSLPRTSSAQGRAGQRVSAGAARPGDIVSYSGHVGIYVGNGKMIHSPHPGKSVEVRPVYGNPQYVRVN